MNPCSIFLTVSVVPPERDSEMELGLQWIYWWVMPVRDERVQRQDWVGGASDQGANLTSLGQPHGEPWDSVSIGGVPRGDKTARP